MDLSTAILTLSENGDLQRIHDKWLIQSPCSTDTAEIESDRLHLQSFAGLFLVCGVACFLALSIYFIRIMLKFREAAAAAGADSISQGQGSLSRSRRLQTLLSLMDEKKDPSSREKKRRKLDRSVSCDDDDVNHESELGRNHKRRPSQISVVDNEIVDTRRTNSFV